MSAAILYTNTDAIRAAVGVTTKEYPDGMLKDQGLETQIRVDVYGWLPTHATLYATGTANGATDAEVHQKDLLVLYCVFCGAVRLVEMIMAAREKVGDGKSEVQRFDIDWAALLEALNKRKDSYRAELEELVNPTDATIGYFGLATPDYDPVTNS